MRINKNMKKKNWKTEQDGQRNGINGKDEKVFKRQREISDYFINYNNTPLTYINIFLVIGLHYVATPHPVINDLIWLEPESRLYANRD